MDKIDDILIRADYFAFTKLIDPDIFACGLAYLNKDDTLRVGHYLKRCAKGMTCSISLLETDTERYTITITREDKEELLVLGNTWIPPAFMAVMEVYNEPGIRNNMRLFPVLRENGMLDCLSMDDSDEYNGSIAVTSCLLLS